MNDLKFCPKCGKESLMWDEDKKMSCKNCDFVLYHNCAAAVAVVVIFGEEILLTKRNQEPEKGKLDLVGGFVDPKEKAETACVREIYEELKFKIKEDKLKILSTFPNVYRYRGIDYNTLDIFFECKVEEKFDVDLDINEVSEIVWIKKSDLNLADIAFESQRVFFKEYLNL